MTSSVLLTNPAVWQYFTYLYQHVMIIVLDDELCTADYVLLCVLIVPHDYCAGKQALYCWTRLAVWQYFTYFYQHVMVIIGQWSSLCRMTSSVLLITSCCVYVLYLQACHDQCAGWQALYYWPHHAVFMNCTYQHAMIIVLDDKLCTVEHVLLCDSTVLTSMSWSLCWMTSSVLLTMSCCVSLLYLPACHAHCAGWQSLYS